MPWFPQKMLWQTEDVASRSKLHEYMHTENASFAAAPIQQQRHTHTHTNIRDCQGITLVEIEIDKDLDAGPKWHLNQTWSEASYDPPIFCFKDGATLLPILTSLDS